MFMFSLISFLLVFAVSAAPPNEVPNLEVEGKVFKRFYVILLPNF